MAGKRGDFLGKIIFEMVLSVGAICHKVKVHQYPRLTPFPHLALGFDLRVILEFK